MRSWRGMATLHRHTGFVSIVRSDPFKERPLYDPFKRLTYRYQGRDFRLTDVAVKVAEGILA